MKRNIRLSLLALSILRSSVLHAQTLSPASEFKVADRGPFYRVWQRTAAITNALTGRVSQQLLSYTELGNGLHYWDNGQWTESQDLIELTPSGAAAVHGPNKAQFSPNLNSVGAITLTTPSGQLFQSHPLGLYYFDAASGKSALIAPLQDTSGNWCRPINWFIRMPFLAFRRM